MYIPFNPADHASRGLSPTETDKMEHWLKGPEFLWQEEKSWPEQPQIPGITDIDSEVRKTARVHATIQTGQEHPLNILIRQSSSWSQLMKSVAWLHRCKLMLLNRKNLPTEYQGGLKLKELKDAACRERVSPKKDMLCHGKLTSPNKSSPAAHYAY